MNKVNWNELRDRVHENAVKHGFWEDENWSLPEKLALIHSEVSEALECDRKSRWFKNNPDMKNILEAINAEFNETMFLTEIKDTFEDELADVVIRCLDLCGKLEIDVSIRPPDFDFGYMFSDDWNTPEHLCCIHALVSTYLEDYLIGFIDEDIENCDEDGIEISKNDIGNIISYTLKLSRKLNIDILKHIELKMKYNELRPHKHGKKY